MLEPDLYRSTGAQQRTSCETLSFFSLPSTPTGTELLVNHLKSLEDVAGAREKEGDAYLGGGSFLHRSRVLGSGIMWMLQQQWDAHWVLAPARSTQKTLPVAWDEG